MAAIDKDDFPHDEKIFMREFKGGTVNSDLYNPPKQTNLRNEVTESKDKGFGDHREDDQNIETAHL